MKEPPKNLMELLVRMEQMKTNLRNHRDNQEVLDFVGNTYVEATGLFQQYNEQKIGQEYLSWYIDFRNRRTT